MKENNEYYKSKVIESVSISGSSSINEISYCEQLSELFITFKNNSTYVYYKVPVEVWNELKEADSKGKFIAKNIKSKFEYSKLEIPKSVEEVL